MNGILYLVATPIGNLQDITLRALDTLKNVDIIAAEDTRHTLKLLNHFEISKPLISLYRHNENVKSNLIIEKLKSGQNIAVVSDAGTPGISDPGTNLVQEAIKNDIKVISIPGACAFVAALTCSGMDTDTFSFIGFLSANKKLRKEKLLSLRSENNRLIFYEAPHKIKETLSDMLEYLGDKKCVIARELTKIHEEIIRGNISELLNLLNEPKGEFVIIIDNNNDNTTDSASLSIEDLYTFYENTGLDKKEIIKQIAKEKGVPKNEIYKYFLNKKRN